RMVFAARCQSLLTVLSKGPKDGQEQHWKETVRGFYAPLMDSFADVLGDRNPLTKFISDLDARADEAAKAIAPVSTETTGLNVWHNLLNCFHEVQRRLN